MVICLCLYMWTGFYQDLGKSKLVQIASYQMLQSSTACKVFKKLWLPNGFALRHLRQLLMSKMLVQNYFYEHWYIGNSCTVLWSFMLVFWNMRLLSGESVLQTLVKDDFFIFYFLRIFILSLFIDVEVYFWRHNYKCVKFLVAWW